MGERLVIAIQLTNFRLIENFKTFCCNLRDPDLQEAKTNLKLAKIDLLHITCESFENERITE